ncbi:MAG: hypothetical protein RL095_1835 [Verrucomicrobiota bacterium]|jgi:hypothetical protein
MKILALIMTILFLGSCRDAVEPLTVELNLEIQVASQMKALGIEAGDKVLFVGDTASSPEMSALTAKFGTQCQASAKSAKDINWPELLGGGGYKMVFCIGVPAIDAEQDLPENVIPLVLSVSNFKSPVPDLVTRGWVATALAPLPILGDKPAVDRELMITSQLQATSVVLIAGMEKGLRERFPQLF